MHASPLLQSSLQKPSLMSYFAWKIFLQSGVSANEWIKHSRTCPIWSIAPPGAVFSLFSFIEGKRPCGVDFNENDRYSIGLDASDLRGITVIGETFIFVGKSPLEFL